MNKLLKWLGVIVGLLLIVAIAIAATGWLQAERRMERRIDVKVAALALPTEAAAIERGRYLFNSRGCAECHGADGGGRKVIDNGGLLVVAPHIGTGPGSVTEAYRVEDWVRAIRHGLRTDGRPLTRGGSWADQPGTLNPLTSARYSSAWQERDPQFPKSRWWLSDGPFVGFRLVREP